MKSAALFILSLLAVQQLRAQITSTFTIDGEGWTCSDNNLSNALAITHLTTGGNPGGYISAGTTSSQPSFFTTPAVFGGNVAYFTYGQQLTFDMQLNYVPTTHATAGDVQIRTSGGQILALALATFPAQAPAWSTHTVLLDETAGWRVGGTTGPLATKAQVLQYMASVHSFRFSIDYTNATANTYNGSIDNVILNQRTLPPAPQILSVSTWAAKPGDPIRINGTGFSPDKFNSTFFFGGVKADIVGSTPSRIDVVVPVGAHYAPITVINNITGLSGTSRQPFNPLFDGGGRIIPASFKPQFSIDHTGGMGGLQLADMDGDGWSDLVVANQDNTGIQIYRNLGNTGPLSAASFDPPVSFPTLLSGTNGAGLTVRDLDNDGMLDMATSGWTGGPGAFATFRNTSTPGNLNFEEVEHWNGASDESPVTAAADIDGDGLIDLVSGEGSSPGATWIIQNISTPGNIEFGYRQTFFGSNSHQGATLADLDGDGKPEFIHRIQNTLNQQNIHVNTSTPGSISFGPAITLPVSIQGSMVVYDFNKDGKNDLAWKDGFSNNDIYIRLNTNSGGPLSVADFSTQVILDSETGYYGGLSMADINGDGEPDLLVTDSDRAGVFENNYSPGTFDDYDFIKGHLFAGVAGSFSYPTSIQSADLNGDGKPEMVFGTTNTSPTKIVIYENQNTAAPEISISTVSPLQAPIGATVTITGNNFSPVKIDNHVYFGGIKASVLTASETELTVSVPPGAGHDAVSVRVGELTSVYRLPFHTTFSSGVTFNNSHFAPPVEFALANADYDIEVADLDNDGKPDVAAQVFGTNRTEFFNNAHVPGSITTGSLSVAGSTASTAINPKLFDIDGDGLIDVVGVGGTMYRNISSPGAIAFGPQLTLGIGAGNFAFADFNRDGKLDLAATNGGSAQLLLLENRSITGTLVAAGTFGSLSNDFNIAKPAAGGGIAAADFDADGLPDIVVTNPGTDNLSIFTSANATRVNATTFGARIDIATGDNPGRIYTGDFDDDNKLDFMIYHGTGTNSMLLSVFHNQSTPGNFLFNRIDLTNPSATTVATVADLDGDGKPEIITTSETGNRFSIFKNIHTSGGLTAASFAAPFNTTVTAPRGLTTGDLNLDGKPEIILTRAAGLLVVYENLISAAFVPSISSFTPASGPIGATVAISGANFSTSPAGNVVYFGATRATVTAATATQLTVTVPAGASYQPISVTVNGQIAFSEKPFTVTFCSVGGIGTSSFAPRQEVSTAPTAGPVSSTVGDLDGDGKSDLIIANRFANTVSVYRNTSSGIGNISYALPVDFPTGSEPVSVAFGDLDGDGKGDVAVAVFGTGTVSVFRNTSSAPGVISLAAKQDFALGAGPFSVAVGDFDKDGKTDLAVANYQSHQVSVLLNTSIGVGNIGFAPRVDFPLGAGAGPYSIAVGDIDQDGKGDLVTANAVSNNISVFLNISSGAGDISYAAGVNFSTGTTPRSVTLSDFDGDNKPDIAVTAEIPDVVSVFRNTSTAGVVSLASRVDFGVSSNPWSVTVGDLDGDGKADLATANESGVNMSVLRNTSSGAGSIDFAANIDFAASGGLVAASLGDFDNDGKLDMVGADFTGNLLCIYRNTIPTATPSISSFSPTTGIVGTVVTITGSNFNTPAPTAVTFNGINAAILDFTPSSIQVSVPSSATTGPINVTTGCGTAVGGVDFIVGATAINITLQPTAIVNACEGSFASFGTAATGTANIAYQWQFSTTSGGTYNDISDGGGYSGATTPSLSINTTGNFGAGFYRAKVDGDFVSTTFTNPGQLTINALPAPPAITNVSRCGAGAVTLTATGSTDGNYRWYTAATGGSAIAGEVNASIITASLTSLTTYYVAVSDGTCESTRVAGMVIINNIPTAPTTTAAARCGEGSVTLTATGSTDGNYRWYSQATGGTAISGATSGAYATPVLTATVTYYVSINNGTCESSRTAVTGTINTPPAKPVVTSSGSTVLCAGQGVTLRAPAGFTYQWSTSATTQEITVTTAGSYTVTVTQNGCSAASDAVVVSVQACATNQPPAIAPTPLSTVVEGKVTLSLINLISDPDNNLDLSTLRIVSPPTSGAQASIVNGELILDYKGIPFLGTDELTIEVCDLAGACTQQKLLVDVIGDVVVYNAISPNGDGKNDKWIIQYIDILADYRANEVTLYNRWGDVVWSGTNYNNSTVVFTGQGNNGNELPTGTYFYKIEFATAPARTGYLSLRR